MKKLVLAALCVFSLRGMETAESKLSNDPVRQQALEFIERAKAIAKETEERARLLQESKAVQLVGPLTVAVLNGTPRSLTMRLTRKEDGFYRASHKGIKAWKSSAVDINPEGYFELQILDEEQRLCYLKNMIQHVNPEWADRLVVEENDWKEWVEKNEVKIQLYPVTKEVGAKGNEHERRLMVSLSR